MGKLQTAMKEARAASTMPENAPNAIKNRAGGLSFTIDDPALRLITMTGGTFFAEPRYYEDDAAQEAKNKEALEKMVELDKGNCSFVNWAPDSTTVEIIRTAVEILSGPNPKDLFSIAVWLRKAMNIRLTPQVLLVVGSRHPAGKPFVREYAQKIVARPDEVKTCVKLHRFLFGKRVLKNCLSLGLGDALSKFGEKALLKYDSDEFPRWKDVLRMLKRKENWPITKPLARFFTHGEVSEATPVALARKELAKRTEFDAQAQELVSKSEANWEVVLSQFGQTPAGKAAVWQYLIEKDLVGYMALLRNLRNLLEARVPQATIDKAAAKLADREEVLGSKQLPFRFASAYEVIEELEEVDTLQARKVLEAIETASLVAAENVPVLPGVTAIFADNSGSMSSNVSEKSKVTCAQAANMLCGITAMRSSAYVLAFGTDVAEVQYTKRSTPIGIAKAVRKADTKGMNTNAHLCIEWLIANKIIPDRVILLSDMQCWDAQVMQVYGTRGESVARSWQKYKNLPGTEHTWLHSVHINGYGDSPVKPEDEKVNLIGGFSEKLFSMLLTTEGCAAKEERSVPTLEQIRQF